MDDVFDLTIKASQSRSFAFDDGSGGRIGLFTSEEIKLKRRRLAIFRRQFEKHLKAHLNEFRAIAFDRLAEVVEAIVPLERLPKSDGANTGLLEAAVLLDALNEAMLRGELGGWIDRFAMRAELSGPFAPYNFVIDPNEEST